jgi:hypothetical protein
LWKHQSGGFLPDQGSGEGLPGHVSVDRETVADAETSGPKRAAELPVPGAPEEPAAAAR